MKGSPEVRFDMPTIQKKGFHYEMQTGWDGDITDIFTSVAATIYHQCYHDVLFS